MVASVNAVRPAIFIKWAARIFQSVITEDKTCGCHQLDCSTCRYVPSHYQICDFQVPYGHFSTTCFTQEKVLCNWAKNRLWRRWSTKQMYQEVASRSSIAKIACPSLKHTTVINLLSLILASSHTMNQSLSSDSQWCWSTHAISRRRDGRCLTIGTDPNAVEERVLPSSWQTWYNISGHLSNIEFPNITRRWEASCLRCYKQLTAAGPGHPNCCGPEILGMSSIELKTGRRSQ